MRKAFYIVLYSFLVFKYSFAQQSNNFIKPPALGFYFSYHDFSAADYIRKHSLSKALRDKEIANIRNMNAGLGIGYLKGLSNHFDLSATLAAASLAYSGSGGQTPETSHLLTELDVSVAAKLLTDRSWISPYAQAGFGVSKYQSDYGAFIPAGIGLQFIFFHDVYVFVNGQYRIPVTALTDYHFYYSIGIAGNIGRKKSPAKKRNPPIPFSRSSNDRDADGIPDSLDTCPDVAGLREFHGCPDRDGDGIPDQDDQCVTVPGFARYHGCPVPDTDGDGIDDEHDSCVSVPGSVRYHGCPAPDTDGDGINDDEDQCITTPGPKINRGCPLVKTDIEKRMAYAAKNIFFITGSYRLSEESYPSLDEVVKILKADPALHLLIEGHTDNIGSTGKNQTLSENRANAVATYLEENGIEKTRLHTVGFGDSNPVATNKTAKGRTQNRRVVFILRY